MEALFSYVMQLTQMRTKIVLGLLTLILFTPVRAEVAGLNYRLAPGDAIRINVFQQPDLTLDTRISENGSITYPLIGSLQLGGETLAAAEQQIAAGLRQGKYVKDPQVTITLLEIRGNQVSVLGQVSRPGRFPLETQKTRLSDVLAMAGGVTDSGSDIVVVSGIREGRPFHREVDFPAIFAQGERNANILVAGGDVIFVDKAPVYYIYGEVQRPGVYRVERNMTVQQALAQGGGVSLRGTDNGIKVYRKDAKGDVELKESELYDLVRADDVIYIRESLF
ncbi:MULTISPECIES: polysaccharide export protein EpsE [unclassified Hahella]|uniref:polysaccharide export protein EpsE n=1 Tax=unclassified Hahella TaxID=2624107 RepID=UPI001C1F0662|nr:MULTISPECIES: polysaccharide export protein EpsE [unclassified Hahella]MBU6955401.1 polysaccharide export protein EpsE [Hahella sp. HN01]MDG9669476.1 polysaccharide export protein EpsE [Hahella sp. CR1]